VVSAPRWRIRKRIEKRGPSAATLPRRGLEEVRRVHAGGDLRDSAYRDDLRQHKLVSSKPFATGDVVARFRAKVELEEPSWLTVQVSESVHVSMEPDILGSLES
jgi:hypothetical protein